MKICVAASVCVVLMIASLASAQSPKPSEVQDLSLLVTPELPCVWPVAMTPTAVIPARPFPGTPYQRSQLVIDEHTGTQFDAPAHFVPPPDSGLPGAGPQGLMTAEKVPIWQFCGEACVIDVRKHRDDAASGKSFLIEPSVVKAWEKEHRELRAGDVVLFRADYSDQYYKPFPEGHRFVALPLRKDTPGWPAPTPETMVYLAGKGVMTLGLDGASMGPLPDLAAATHQAGGKRSMIWTECATNLGSLPTTGAFYAMLAPKHAGGSGSECRAIAITELKLASRLNKNVRAKRVADLSVLLDENYPVTWPGDAAGDEAPRYVAKTLNAFKTRGPFFAMTHLLDSAAGTHVVAPSFACSPDLRSAGDEPRLQATLKKYQASYGEPKPSTLAIDELPLAQMMGEAYVIDVRSLIGTTKEDEWPASPSITLDLVKQHEAKRPIKPGEVVIFYSGYTDEHFQPLPQAPELDRLMAAPLAGKAEGWPAPTPEVIAYLAEKGVRCVGTDGPTLGGVDRENALLVNWLAGSRELLPIEFLTNVAAIADKKAFFIFAPVKIKGTAAGYGRALAIYDEGRD